MVGDGPTGGGAGRRHRIRFARPTGSTFARHDPPRHRGNAELVVAAVRRQLTPGLLRCRGVDEVLGVGVRREAKRGGAPRRGPAVRGPRCAAGGPAARTVRPVRAQAGRLDPRCLRGGARGVFEARRKARRPSLVYCGDDSRSKEAAAGLIRDVGFEPVDAGPLPIARYAEPFTLLVAQLAYEGDGGPELAYRFERFA